MFNKSESITISASKQAIWHLWSDVAGWSTWDKDIEWAKLEGEFRKGQKGVLKPKGGPAVSFTIIECETNKRFVDVANLPFAKLHFIHEMKDHPQGVNVTHTIQITGPLSFLFGKVLGNQLAKGLPDVLENLANAAKS